LGYSSFSDEVPFDTSLFVEFRKRLGLENLNAINSKIVELKTEFEKKKEHPKSECDSDDINTPNKGTLIMDATACPQNIAYPTDLNLLNDAREKSEQLIDYLFCEFLHEKKPRTYREKARTIYLKTA
jgi:IS5 family transposase